MTGGMGGMPVPDVVPELVLLVGSIIVLVFALFAPRRFQSWAVLVALTTLAATAAATVQLMGSLDGAQRFTFFDTYAVDGAALWGKMIIVGTTAVVVALSVNWFAGDPRHGEYYAILLMSALGAVLLAGASDLMELTLAVLLSSATGSILALTRFGGHPNSPA
ncbi:MAG: hypothetical protein ACR2GG_08365 [Gemmatimonadaceae bacterium]